MKYYECCGNRWSLPSLGCPMCGGKLGEDSRPASCSPSVASRYGWVDSNRSKKFDSWEAEIAHVESLGYTLVPPDYHIPHWSAQYSKNGPPPKLYVLRNDGPDEMRSSFDCPAARLGYPVFFKANCDSAT